MEDRAPINLRIPGPTPLPPEVRQMMAGQMLNHRGPEYAAIQAEVIDGLRHFFRTTGDILLFTASGTGGLEAAVVNTLSPGDRVLAVTIGAFGERLAAIAAAYGAAVERLSVPWGMAARPEMLAEALAHLGPVQAVLLTANETSTGVINPLRELTAVVRALPGPAPLIVVDAISALGAADLPMDDLGVDVFVTGSQKAWMAPPGMAMLGVSSRAWEAYAGARMPRFYWDFGKQRVAQAKGQDAWTPAVGTMVALQAGLRLMRAEGREAIVARHIRLAGHTQAGLSKLGFTLFAQPSFRSPTVTAAKPPAGVDCGALIGYLRRERQVIVGGGQGQLAGSILRIGHMGWVSQEDIDDTLSALADGVHALRRPTSE